MRHLKWLGIAVVAAMLLTGLLGAGSASATVLCKENKNPCGGNHYPAETEIHAVLAEGGAKSTVNGIWTTVECGLSTMTAKITKAGGFLEPVRATIQAFTLEECKCAGQAVGSTHATVVEKGALEFIQSSEDDATIWGEATRVTYNCTPLGTQCIFGVPLESTILGELIGGATAKTSIKDKLNHVNGTNDEGTFICGSTAEWTASYEITSPKPIHAAGS